MPRAEFNSASLYAFDAEICSKYNITALCGVDEAGRGPLCGPVSVAAVILQHPVPGVNDSKKLSEKRREELYEQIVQNALAWQVVLVPPDVIDEMNILHATMWGMQQAVQQLSVAPQMVMVDGNRAPALPYPCQTVTKGDGVSAHIAAASVLAKVTRDRYMKKLDEEYPQYQLAKHKGYPTKLHYELLEQYGVQPFYRRSFLRKRGL